MTIANNVKIFLKEKLERNKLNRKDFAKEIGIPYDTFNKLINEESLNPDLYILLNIAKTCKCTIDEVIGRTDYYLVSKNYEFKNISWDEINNNLRNFINAKVTEKQLENKKFTYQKLSKEIGLSANTISKFNKGITQNLRTAVIIALADYSKISIDTMIGRVQPQNQNSSSKPQN